MATNQRRSTMQLEPWEAAFELGQIADQLAALPARLAHIYSRLSTEVAARLDGIKGLAALDVTARLSDFADSLPAEHDAVERQRDRQHLTLARAM